MASGVCLKAMETAARHLTITGELAAGLVVMTLLVMLFAWSVGTDGVFVALALAMYLLLALGLAAAARGHPTGFGWANRVTLVRAMLVIVLAAALVEPAIYREIGWWLATIALLALILDGVDGWLARRFDQQTGFGARFDMEVDAALVMVLCLGVMATGKVGPWVLAIGLMRYVFVVLTALWPWMDRPLPASFRRRLVCVWQVVSLLVVLTPLAGPAFSTLGLTVALLLLIASFAADVAWLYRHRAASGSGLRRQPPGP